MSDKSDNAEKLMRAFDTPLAGWQLVSECEQLIGEINAFCERFGRESQPQKKHP